MVTVAARGAAEDSLRRARQGVHAAARAARLARVGGRHLDERASGPCEFVTEHLCEAGPSSASNATSTPTSDHPRDVQFLQHDDAVALGESCRLDVQEVVALPPHLAVDTGDASLSLLPVFRSFLPSADGALSVNEPLQGGFEVAWIGNHFAIGRCAEVGDATIDCHDGLVARGRIDVQFADDAGEPLVSIALEGASLRLPIDRSMHDSADRAELGESNIVAVESPHLRMWLAEGQDVAPLSFEARGSRELLEASLPRLVEFDEEMVTNVTRHVGEPRECSTKLGQFLHLIERCGVNTFLARSIESHEPLLVGDVPEEPKRVVPASETRNLRVVQVDAEPKCLHDTQRSSPSARWTGCPSSIYSSTLIGRVMRIRCFLIGLNAVVHALETR